MPGNSDELHMGAQLSASPRKATFTNQDVIRRVVPIATERGAAKSVLI
jgi:hypothetical protein